MKKTIITVVGKDSVGIIAKVCTYLSENGINILDISQTIVDGFFNMMMVNPGGKGSGSGAFRRAGGTGKRHSLYHKSPAGRYI